MSGKLFRYRERKMTVEATPADAVEAFGAKALLEALGAEREWQCLYPEFGDPSCLYDHRPTNALMPHKHDGCGWRWMIDVEDTP